MAEPYYLLPALICWAGRWATSQPCSGPAWQALLEGLQAGLAIEYGAVEICC